MSPGALRSGFAGGVAASNAASGVVAAWRAQPGDGLPELLGGCPALDSPSGSGRAEAGPFYQPSSRSPLDRSGRWRPEQPRDSRALFAERRRPDLRRAARPDIGVLCSRARLARGPTSISGSRPHHFLPTASSAIPAVQPPGAVPMHRASRPAIASPGVPCLRSPHGALVPGSPCPGRVVRDARGWHCARGRDHSAPSRLLATLGPRERRGRGRTRPFPCFERREEAEAMEKSWRRPAEGGGAWKITCMSHTSRTTR